MSELNFLAGNQLRQESGAYSFYARLARRQGRRGRIPNGRTTGVIRLTNDNNLLGLTRKGAVKGCEGQYLACFRKLENRLFIGKGNVAIIVSGIGHYVVGSRLGWSPCGKIGRERIGGPNGYAIDEKSYSLNPQAS